MNLMSAIQPRTFALGIGLISLGLLAAVGLSRPPLPAEQSKETEPKVTAEAVSAKQSEDEQAIRKACAAYTEAMNKGDLDTLLSMWAPDAVYINEAGKETSGTEAIRALLKQELPRLKGHKIDGRILSLKFPRPDVALEHGIMEITAPDGKREANRYSVVWVKSGDRWRISGVYDLAGDNQEAASAAAAQLKQLEWLVGEWEGQGEGVTVHLTCHWAVNHSFLLVDFTVQRNATGPKVVTERLGWDPANEVLRSWVFDSLGGFSEGVWERNGNHWVVEVGGVLPDGRSGSSTNHWEFVDATHFVWRSTDRQVDSQPMADATVKFVRKTTKQ
jgi:uncharacterized protein (TIGR02246 family)